MALKETHGNMYSWISHFFSYLGGECPHQCTYCYVNNPLHGGRAKKYQGPLWLDERALKTNLGVGKVIFTEAQNDLFAAEVPQEFIDRVFDHVHQFQHNTYVWQTKNPARYETLLARDPSRHKGFPTKSIFGTTIETNRDTSAISKAPSTTLRMLAMERLPSSLRKFVTMEPILDFDVDILAKWVARIKPEFLNLGADSKKNNLPEPTVDKVMALVAELKKYGIDLREKANLNRLKQH